MSKRLGLEDVLSIGVDPHRETLEVVGIHFPEEILLDETFDNTAAGHRALLTKAKQLASEHELRLVFGLEESGNYAYTLGRYLVKESCQVKEVNLRMTNRQRDFYGQDKSDHLDALSAAAIVMRAYDKLPNVTPVQEATEATRELSRYREQLVKEQAANLNRLHSLLANQYSAYKTFFSQVNGITALAFWATYPTPSHLKGVTINQLADFVYQKSNHRLGKEASRKKAQHILASCHWQNVSPPDLLSTTQGQIIRDLAQRLLQLKRSIQAVEKLPGSIAQVKERGSIVINEISSIVGDSEFFHHSWLANVAVTYLDRTLEHSHPGLRKTANNPSLSCFTPRTELHQSLPVRYH